MADEGSAAPGWDTPGGLGPVSLERISLALLRTPFSARTWLAAASLVLSVLVGACFFAIAAVTLAAGAALAGIPGTAAARNALTVRLPARLTRFDRWRVPHLNGIDIGVRVPPDGGGRSLRPALYQLVGSDSFRDIVDPAKTVAVVRANWANSQSPSQGRSFSLRTMNDTGTLHTTPGYDDVTGLGSPLMTKLVQALR